MFSDVDRAQMAHALALAGRGLFTASPNPRVGCVIARDGVVLGEGFHARAGLPHAEVEALADAARRGHVVRGATLYVTLEPCAHHGRTPPCADAVINAGLARVVVAMRDPNPVAGGGIARLRAAGIDVEEGVEAEAAREINVGFVSRMTRGLPWVRLKVAASLDGRTALADGESRWITGPDARADGHAWRARACAVLTGIGTVLADDPALTVRDVETSRQPLRVIVDRDGRTPPGARILAAAPPGADARSCDDSGSGADAPPGGDAPSKADVLIVTAGARNAAWPANVEVVALPDGHGRVDLGALLRMLAARGVNELHVECGARLNGAFLESDLVDELLVYLAPDVIGDPAPGMFARASALASLGDRTRFQWGDVRRVGRDLRLLARRVRESV